jgi:hypothetical protein
MEEKGNRVSNYLRDGSDMSEDKNSMNEDYLMDETP